ncbi:MAG TPA: aminotransferase class V-fold PLP-dependent enzyme [Aequorivita sp.]|nr:aminotransferase class V-fold PLP-dependent enzyme [Aequorivita sp.]
MEQLKNHFPALSKCTYLNTAANGIVPKPVIEWRRQHDLDLMNQACTFRQNHKTHIDQIRSTVSRFIGAREGETALVPNFSFGINSILEGLPKGQKVLLLKDDYPSINWPVEMRDFDVCYANIDENLEENIQEAVNRHRPDVFIFSIVQWLSGIKINLEFLKQLKRSHPNLLLIGDGTQYFGTENFDFAENAIDVLGSSGYKWLNAGFGNGFIAIKTSVRDRIFPKIIGFNSAERLESSALETEFMKHFEPGHQDTLNYGSLEEAIQFTENLGREKLYEHINSISALAKEKFAARNLLAQSTLRRERHSSIFNLIGDSTLFQKLKANNIICSPRGGGIRVSFHYYNTEEDLERLLDVLN